MFFLVPSIALENSCSQMVVVNNLRAALERQKDMIHL